MNNQAILAEARAIEEWVVALRRKIHQRPELMYEEVETSRLVCETLDELGIDSQVPIAETGVVATIGSGDGPCVALRADMDALPIHEEVEVDFRSQIDGKMHACGHDCHTAMLLGAARLLKQREDELQGTVKLLFQPAEEGGAGGERMRREGALENPVVQRIFGLHVMPWIPSGEIASRAGTLLAATSTLTIVIHGKGGHAAAPHMPVDPVVAAAKAVVEVQSLVARELDPLDSGVVSITTMRGGEVFNVIPQQVELTGTIRALTVEGLQLIQARVKEMVEHIALANRCRAEVDFPGYDYPPTVNDAHCWDLARDIGGNLLGTGSVSESPPLMAGEDFAYYLEQVPGVFVGLGMKNEAIEATYNVHHPRFKADEAVLSIGVALHVAFALASQAELAGD